MIDIKIAWVDRDRREYELSDISDSYLINILNYVYSGGGWDSFVNVQTMKILYNESVERGLDYRIPKKRYMNKIKERNKITIYRTLHVQFDEVTGNHYLNKYKF